MYGGEEFSPWWNPMNASSPSSQLYHALLTAKYWPRLRSWLHGSEKSSCNWSHDQILSNFAFRLSSHQTWWGQCYQKYCHHPTRVLLYDICTIWLLAYNGPTQSLRMGMGHRTSRIRLLWYASQSLGSSPRNFYSNRVWHVRGKFTFSKFKSSARICEMLSLLWL